MAGMSPVHVPCPPRMPTRVAFVFQSGAWSGLLRPPTGFCTRLELGPEIWTQQLVALGDVRLPEGQPPRPSGCNFRPRKVTF